MAVELPKSVCRNRKIHVFKKTDGGYVHICFYKSFILHLFDRCSQLQNIVRERNTNSYFSHDFMHLSKIYQSFAMSVQNVTLEKITSF